MNSDRNYQGVRLHSMMNHYSEEYLKRYKHLPMIQRVYDFVFLFEFTQIQERAHVPYGAQYYLSNSMSIVVLWPWNEPRIINAQMDTHPISHFEDFSDINVFTGVNFSPLSVVYADHHSEYEMDLFYRLFNKKWNRKEGESVWELNAYKKARLRENRGKFIDYEWSFSDDMRTKPENELTDVESMWMEYSCFMNMAILGD